MRSSRTTSSELGASGEDAVAAWYVRSGYRVVARNWRCREGELDIVAVAPGVVVFCEVKTRTSDAFGAPVEAVGAVKQRRVRALAARWLRSGGKGAAGAGAGVVGELRFDVASVLGGEVEVIEGAF